MSSTWLKIAGIILRQRIIILLIIGGVTTFMWINQTRERAYGFEKIVSDDDPDYAFYKQFKRDFGEDGNALVIGFKGDVFSQGFLNGLIGLSRSIQKVLGVQKVISLPELQLLEFDTTTNDRFRWKKLLSEKVTGGRAAKRLKQRLDSLPFYRELLLNKSGNVTVLIALISPEVLNTYEKVYMMDTISSLVNHHASEMNAEVYYSGLPYIRVDATIRIAREMKRFLIFAILITTLTLIVFFRSFWAVIIPLFVVGIVAVWALGFMGLLGYKINALTAVLPALVTVIGIPNSIYLLNKYHLEYARTGNKIKSLVLVIGKIGIVTIMTNATTAIGFLVLATTGISMLQEFGIVAGLSILSAFIIALLLIPIIFSFLPAPGPKQLKHISRKSLGNLITFLQKSVRKHKAIIYSGTIILAAAATWGITRINPVSYMLDDIPEKHRVKQDMLFFEEEFNGILPFEIIVNTHQKYGIFRQSTLKGIERLQDSLKKFESLSVSLSIADIVKYGRQTWLSGVASEYKLPSPQELQVLSAFQRNTDWNLSSGTATLFDTSYARARIKVNIKDVGSRKLKAISQEVQRIADTIFLDSISSGRLKQGYTYQLYGSENFTIEYGGKSYRAGEKFIADNTRTYTVQSGHGKIDLADKVRITGTTQIFLKGNAFLIRNLIQSFLIAFLVIAFLMTALFRSFKMVIIALLPNFFPLLLTAGIMGYFGIPLKPSTALIFSVAFGIAVDDTIHFLARYRLAIKAGKNIPAAVNASFRDTGLSMIYTSIILFFGFVIFAFSNYGGTIALGQLTSLTLIIALFANLLLLPALLLSFHRKTIERE